MALLNARRRRILASVSLGSWLFAFFVGVAHACGIEAVLGPVQQPVTVAADIHDHGDEDALPGCERLCADDFPLLAKLQAVQDQVGGQALFLPGLGEPLVVRVAWAPSQVRHLHPPPDIAPTIRFVRLAL